MTMDWQDPRKEVERLRQDERLVLVVNLSVGLLAVAFGVVWMLIPLIVSGFVGGLKMWTDARRIRDKLRMGGTRFLPN